MDATPRPLLTVDDVLLAPSALASPQSDAVLTPSKPGVEPCCGGGYEYPSSSEDYVVNQWIAPNGVYVMYRKGFYNASQDKGFGKTKVVNKHNLLREDLMGYTVTHGQRVLQSNGRWRFTQKFKSEYGRYITIWVVATKNTPTLKDGFPKGVITAYCLGYTQCPPWVNIVGFNPA